MMVEATTNASLIPPSAIWSEAHINILRRFGYGMYKEARDRDIVVLWKLFDVPTVAYHWVGVKGGAALQIEVTVDKEKCGDAYGCHKCVEACARGSLSLIPTAPSLRGVMSDTKGFTIIGRHLADCTTCMDCVRLCPEGAIKVSVH